MKKYLEPAKEINVYGEFDVIVVGGGCAGFPAAIASARNGAKTLVIERFPYFGGTATASLMANINGFRNQVKPDQLQTTKGIGEELMLRLKEIGGLSKSPYKEASEHTDTKGDLSYSFTIDTEKYKYMTLKMVKESGAHILFHTYFTDVIMEGNKIVGIIIENKSGRQAVFGKVIVDASGDGDVAYKAGVPFWQVKHDEDVRMVDTLMYKVAGFPNDLVTDDYVMHGCKINSTMVLWGPSPAVGDGTDGEELSREEVEARLAVYDNLEEQKKGNPLIKDAKVIETGPLLGIRQTRFIEGLYKLTGEDVIEGKSFEDSVAMAANPIIHYYGYRRYLEHEGYEIPYRCLLPQKITGLIMAGRCISCDQRAFESLRAMAHIYAIGEAAGTAAALSSKNNVEPHKLDVKMLRDQLIEQGAEIGQGKSKK